MTSESDKLFAFWAFWNSFHFQDGLFAKSLFLLGVLVVLPWLIYWLSSSSPSSSSSSSSSSSPISQSLGLTQKAIYPPKDCVKVGRPHSASSTLSFSQGTGPCTDGASPWRVDALNIYPIKSCRGISLASAAATRSGLEGDRAFCLAACKERRGEKEKWEVITQRRYPLMARVETEVWVPKEGAQVAGQGRLIVRFPGGRGSEECKMQFEVLLAPSATESQIMGYRREEVTVWSDTIMALRMDSEKLEELQLLLGVKRRLALFRVEDGVREIHRNVPTREEIGYQPVLRFQDDHPLHIINVASTQELATHMPHGGSNSLLSIDRFRANIVVSGPPAYHEDTWRRIRIGANSYDVACRTTRCKLPNVDQQTGERHASEPDRTLRRRPNVDEGAGKSTGCLGMQMVPLSDRGVLRVGDEMKVLELGNHFYQKSIS